MDKTCGLTIPKRLESGIIYLKQIDQAFKLIYTNVGSNKWSISTLDNNFEEIGEIKAFAKKLGNLVEITENDLDNDISLVHTIYQCGQDYYVDLTDDLGIKSTHSLTGYIPIISRHDLVGVQPVDKNDLLRVAVNAWNDNSTTAKGTYGNISEWDTSNITDMRDLFDGMSNFNDDISKWDVQNVTSMEGMFRGADKFNGIIQDWDTSNVTSMKEMFLNATKFNGLISNWDTGKVTTMARMFAAGPDFPPSNFNNMNESLIQEEGSTETNWNTSNVKNMTSMFQNSNFNLSISSWDTSKVTDMTRMFAQTANFNNGVDDTCKCCKHPSPLIWDTSNVLDMASMFQEALKFNQSIQYWNTSKVTEMSQMFYGAKEFNQPLKRYCDFWNTSNVIAMDAMFLEATKFNQPLNSWDTTLVRSCGDFAPPGATYSPTFTIAECKNPEQPDPEKEGWNQTYNNADRSIGMSGSNPPAYGPASELCNLFKQAKDAESNPDPNKRTLPAIPDGVSDPCQWMSTPSSCFALYREKQPGIIDNDKLVDACLNNKGNIAFGHYLGNDPPGQCYELRNPANKKRMLMVGVDVFPIGTGKSNKQKISPAGVQASPEMSLDAFKTLFGDDDASMRRPFEYRKQDDCKIPSDP